jgi:hypothetical protein
LGNVDVTEKIKELYSKGIYVIDGSNSVFVDPLTGAIKNLEI